MEKQYNPQQYENEIYAAWKNSGFFHPENLLDAEGREPFAVMMPPPNVTGVLHLGHALENTLLDAKIRFERMRGKRALLLPGTDHAAVATQAKVEGLLKKGEFEWPIGSGKFEQSDNPRKEFGRDGLLERIRGFAEQSKATILNQIEKMGTSADWDRLAYTFDEQRNRAVNELFVRMYNDGLIYRGYRVVNWSVKGQSTCSDDELVYVTRPSKLYTFRYSADFPIPIATTRPETKLGDTAVAVHPDGQWKEYIGQTFEIAAFGGANGAGADLTIRVIADDGIDPDFGTGALGVTTAHAQIDYEMYVKNPEIGVLPVIGKDGKMLPVSGSAYAGLSVPECREKIVDWLRDSGLMISEEDIEQNVATSDRFGDIVEAVPMEQWFINVNKEVPGRGKTLKDFMREAVTTGHGGDAAKKIEIIPGRFQKVYDHWIEGLRDWNISRQIWWGHRIPAWHKDGEVKVQVESPGEGWAQDEDTLDTWFSSGSWTFSTLGWPEDTADMKTYHQGGTSWMQMGHEILFFWMARMILMTTYALDDIPFKRVYIHGILRDKEGKKFSKSSGNGINPLDVIAEYGTDALRMSLIENITPGNDARFYEDKVVKSRNFVTKLWNVARFVNEKAPAAPDGIVFENLSQPDQLILASLQDVIREVTADFEHDRFGLVPAKLYDFVWNDFAAWYLEEAKRDDVECVMQRYVLTEVLKLLHPVAPFVTEVIAKELELFDSLLLIAQWPVANDAYTFTDEITNAHEHIAQLLKERELKKLEEKKDPKVEAEIAARKKEELAQAITVLEGRLANPSYSEKAPAHLVQQTRDELEEKKRLLNEL